MSLADILRHAGSDACALIIGTGLLNGARVPDSDMQTIMVFEPHPDRLGLLQLQQARRPNLLVSPASVGIGQGPLLLQRFNYPALDGFFDPDALHKVFPGLVVTQHVPVEQTPVTSLPGLLPAASGNRDVLVIDQLGREWDILQGLDQSGVLPRFSEVIVRTSRCDLLAEGQTAGTLINWMHDRDFDRWLEIGQSDPAIPVLHFSRNLLRAEVRALADKVADLGQVELHARLTDILQVVPQETGTGAPGTTAARRGAKPGSPKTRKSK